MGVKEMNENLESKLREKEKGLMTTYLDLADESLDFKEVQGSIIYLMRFKIFYNTLGVHNEQLDERYENIFSRYKIMRYSNQY